jgi:hypothetical protein
MLKASFVFCSALLSATAFGRLRVARSTGLPVAAGRSAQQRVTGVCEKILFLAAMLSSMSAGAATLSPLAIPSKVPSAYPAKANCIATTFIADDSVNGTCASTTASGSSGHGGHPTYTSLVYTVSWDVYGNALRAGSYCGKYVSNTHFISVWTYAAGFDATTCYLPAPGSTQIDLYDPSHGFDVWFYYLSTSADGAYALIAQGVYGFIYGF